MPYLITRRKLLSSGIKTGIGLAVLRELSLKADPVIAFTTEHQPQTERFQPAFQRLDEFIARHLNDIGAPGMTLAIANRDGLLRSSQYGFADQKAGIKVGPQTLFEIGSISKSFVAIAILQIADEGKLDLHKPVTDYLPWLNVETKFAPFTTHHLLSHTSGLSGVPLLVRQVATKLTTSFEPGTKFVYSNIGYALLGFILEAIDKKPWGEVLRKRVLDPLGMNASDAIITNSTRERAAVGYVPFYDDRPFQLKGKLAEAPWIEVPETAGSIASTPGDMSAYLQMLLNRGAGPRGRVLSEKAFTLFTSPVIKAPFRGEDASYGYGLWTSTIEGRTLLRHTGGMISFSSAMYADVTEGYAAFASVNARIGGYRPVVVTKYALDLLRASVHGQELPPMPPPPPSPEVIKNASDYAGTFTSQGEKQKLTLVADGDRLILKHKEQSIALELAGPDRFIVKHPDYGLFTLTFGRDKGSVVEAFYGSDWWTNEKYSGPKTFDYPKDWDAFTGHYRSDSPLYGSVRALIRKGRLTLDGDQPLSQVSPAVFLIEGDDSADRIAFDMMTTGKSMRMTYAGIEFYRTHTP